MLRTHILRLTSLNAKQLCQTYQTWQNQWPTTSRHGKMMLTSSWSEAHTCKKHGLNSWLISRQTRALQSKYKKHAKDQKTNQKQWWYMIQNTQISSEMKAYKAKNACYYVSQSKDQRGTKGRGVSLPYIRLQNTSLTTENPLVFGGEKTKNTKLNKASRKGTKKTKTRPRRVSLCSNPQVTLMKVLKQENIRLFYVEHKVKNTKQDR